MAKTKAELLGEAEKLGLKLTEKNTIAEINEAIKNATQNAEEKVAGAVDESQESFAKAGKRSAKAVEEVKEKLDKEARKAAGDTTPQGDGEAHEKKGPKPITRPRSERRGKAYRTVQKKVESGKAYTLSEAVKLATETSVGKFDSTVEMHVRLGVDPRQADQNIRATVSLPNGTGKTIRVAAFVPESDAEAVKKAGADIVGEESIIKALDKESIDFDVLVATPQLMPKLGKYARLLGPRGLMPNPKAGTVSTNPVKAVEEAKAGKVEYRVDKQAIVHLGIGKVSFGPAKLEQNAKTFIDSLVSNKPSSLKGGYILSMSVTTTMGPGIKVEATNL